MNTPEEYFLDALEVVETWDLPDEQSVVNAANQQAQLMAGQFNYEYSETNINNH